MAGRPNSVLAQAQQTGRVPTGLRQTRRGHTQNVWGTSRRSTFAFAFDPNFFINLSELPSYNIYASVHACSNTSSHVPIIVTIYSYRHLCLFSVEPMLQTRLTRAAWRGAVVRVRSTLQRTEPAAERRTGLCRKSPPSILSSPLSTTMSSSLLARRLLSRPSPSLRALSRSLASSSKTPVPQAGESTAAAAQAPNAPQPWSDSQRARPAGRTGPRFEQANMELQPNPLSAQALIEQEPIRLVHGRVASCDGGACRTW